MKNLWKRLKALFPARRLHSSDQRGVFQYDEKKGKMVKVRETPREAIGKYAMPIDEWQRRRFHLTKGSWARPMDKRTWDSNWDQIFKGGGIRGSKLRQFGLWWKKILGR